MSGVHIRAYAKRYQSDLAGLVFFDGSTPLQDPLFPPVYAEIDRQRRSEVPRELAMMAFGIDRLQGDCAPDLTGGVAAYARRLAADTFLVGPFLQAQRCRFSSSRAIRACGEATCPRPTRGRAACFGIVFKND